MTAITNSLVSIKRMPHVDASTSGMLNSNALFETLNVIPMGSSSAREKRFSLMSYGVADVKTSN